jgi:hypothetical protein
MSGTSFAQLMRLVESESIDGVRLLESPNDNPICSLSYDKSIRSVTIVWRRYPTSVQLRFVHEILIQMLTQYKANKILGDDSDLPIIHAEDQKWISEDWLPRAKAAGLRAAAAKVPFSFFGRLSIGIIQSKLAQEIAIKAFPNIHQARTWLQTFPE